MAKQANNEKKRTKNSTDTYAEYWKAKNPETDEEKADLILEMSAKFNVQKQAIYQGLRYHAIQPTKKRQSIPIEREALVTMLNEHKGSIVGAAEAIGVSHQTLRGKMRQLRIQKKVTFE